MKTYRTGEFAKKANVTIRTLRHYDQRGLLKPSAYSDSGQRLYTNQDFARLQQILTLKLIGLSLAEIKGLLTTDRMEIEVLLDRQKQVLREQAQQLNAVIRAIDTAQKEIQAAQSLDWEQFIAIIKVVTMNMQSDWLGHFLTDSQKQAYIERTSGLTLMQQKESAEAWKTLFEDIQAAMRQENPEVLALVRRWDTLFEEFAGGDPDFATRLQEAYTRLGEALPLGEAAEWVNSIEEAARFIQAARHVQSQ
jgi:MerR family transcriptional regulator, thiopeptide resistance regulator